MHVNNITLLLLLLNFDLTFYVSIFFGLCFDSHLFSNFCAPFFKDLCIGRKLGNGSFCMVHEVNIINHHQKQQQQNQLENNSSHNNNNNVKIEHPYAIKRIDNSNNTTTSTKKLKDDGELMQGYYDLMMEIQYLSVLSHRNIISVHGISNHQNSNNNDNSNNTYYKNDFVILDKLQYSLKTQLKEWKINQYHHKNNIGISKLIFDYNGKKETLHFMKRLQYSYDIAYAIQYLHSNQ